jgi:hypothetical protein
MARTVQNLFINGGQTFSITVDGLNPVTEVKLFFDGELVPSSLVRQIVTAPTIDYMGPVFNVANFGSKLITDANGSITLEFLYTDSIAKQNFTTDAEYYSFKEFNTGPKTLIVMDAATAASITAPLSNSLGSTLLTDTLRNARCYAAGVVQLSYGVSFLEIKPAPITTAFAGGDGGYDGPPGGGYNEGEGGVVFAGGQAVKTESGTIVTWGNINQAQAEAILNSWGHAEAYTDSTSDAASISASMDAHGGSADLL